VRLLRPLFGLEAGPVAPRTRLAPRLNVPQDIH
jgi:hypothetical protein